MCKSVSHLPVAQVRVSSLNPGYPRKKGSSSRQADFLSVVSTGRDTGKRHLCLPFCCQGVYLLGNAKELSGCLQSAGAANSVQGDGGMSCQGHLVCKDPMFSIGGANALGNW